MKETGIWSPLKLPNDLQKSWFLEAKEIEETKLKAVKTKLTKEEQEFLGI